MKKVMVLNFILVVILNLSSEKIFSQEDKKNSNAHHYYIINSYAVSYKYKSSGKSLSRQYLELSGNLSIRDLEMGIYF